jgi:hypothetical protein
MDASLGQVKLTYNREDPKVLATPYPLGPFQVERDGALSFRDQGGQARFHFDWRGHRFRAVLTTGHITLNATIGRVPSSAAGTSQRERVVETLRILPRLLPSFCRLRLLPDHRVQLETEKPMMWPMTAAALLAPVTATLLVLAPYLDLLEEAGLSAARS